MQIEIRLKKVLADAHLDRHGVIQKIADYADVHRHTIRKIYSNRHPHVPLELLGKICDWLISQGVKAEILPEALFGAAATELWRAAAAAGTVRIYLGEYQQFQGKAHISWISRRDAAVLQQIIQWMSSPGVCGDSKPAFVPEYVPFRVDESARRINLKEVKAEHAAALATYRKIRANLQKSSAILVGSQRINRLVEAFVSELFGCRPFVAESRRARVPFYMAYQSGLRPVESCFGGLTNPPGRSGKFIRGTHFLNRKGEWDCIPWIEDMEDAGVVITSSQRGTKESLIAIFGLRGRATEALGDYLIKNPAPFWPPYAEKHDRKIGVYICRITYPPKGSIKPGEPDRAENVQVIPLDEGILTQHLKGK